MTNKNLLKNVILAAMFAAIICVFTMFLKIPIVGGQGYIHLGDMAIYLGASILPLPYACVAAAVGGAMADILGGYAVWAPSTLVIKLLLTIPFTSKKSKIINPRNGIAAAIGVVITVEGYYIAQWIIYSNSAAALLSVPWNIAQAIGSGLLYIVIGFALDKMNFKKHIGLGEGEPPMPFRNTHTK